MGLRAIGYCIDTSVGGTAMPLDSEAMVEALGAIRDASEVVPLRAQVMRALALVGIDAAYFVAPLTRESRVGRTFTSINFPRIWERHYRARLHLVDPLPSLSLEIGNAFRWPDDLPTEKLGRKQSRYLKIASAYGHARGIGVACYGPHGRAGFLGVGWNGEDAAADVVLLAVHIIGQTSFQRYCALMRSETEMPALSNRELEVLGWMCRGKSNPAMAEIIGVSRSSIDAYIRRIFGKLKVTDRTAACVRAYSLGLMTTDEVEQLVQAARLRDDRPGSKL